MTTTVFLYTLLKTVTPALSLFRTFRCMRLKIFIEQTIKKYYNARMDKKFEMDKTKTALVVIDLQKGIASRQTQPYAPAEVILTRQGVNTNERKI